MIIYKSIILIHLSLQPVILHSNIYHLLLNNILLFLDNLLDNTRIFLLIYDVNAIILRIYDVIEIILLVCDVIRIILLIYGVNAIILLIIMSTQISSLSVTSPQLSSLSMTSSQISSLSVTSSPLFARWRGVEFRLQQQNQRVEEMEAVISLKNQEIRYKVSSGHQPQEPGDQWGGLTVTW